MELVPFVVIEELALQVQLPQERAERWCEALAEAPMKAVEERLELMQMEELYHKMAEGQKVVTRCWIHPY